MQPSSTSQNNSLKNTELHDSVSQNTYSLEQGILTVRSSSNSQPRRYSLSPNYEQQVIARPSLKFKKINSSGLVFAPSGKSFTCKSDKLNEVDMNIAYTQGVVMWSISCSSNCLSLIVGVKNVEKKKQFSLNFTIQNSTTIVFKLDIPGNKLKSWANKPLSTSQKSVKLNEEITSWTPFIRVKGIGVSIFLDTCISDPQEKVSQLNPFSIRKTSTQPKLSLSKMPQINKSSFSAIRKIDENTLLLSSNNQIKIIRRQENEKQFNLNLGQWADDGTYFVTFQESQAVVLRKAGFVLEGEGAVGMKVEQWGQWMLSGFTVLDTQLSAGVISQTVYNRACQILLTKLQSFRQYLKLQLQPIPQPSKYSYTDQQQSKKVNIPKSIRLNNETPLRLNKVIKQLIWTQHYLIALMEETQRLIIINRQDSLFKVSQINLKRGFKKQYELNQYQKQLDLLQTGDVNQPSIYKILKNCLKYADKIKLPEKEKQVIEKKEKKQVVGKKAEKQKDHKKSKKLLQNLPCLPDKSLVNTLVTMGFSTAEANSALMQSNNSLEKAIEIIFKKQQNSVPVATKKGEQKLWSCPQCTLNNPSTALICQACELPKPAQTILIQQQQQFMKEEEKIEVVQPKEQKLVEEEVQSLNIQQSLNKIFAFELGFAYCPLVLAGVFEKKLRLRLFGPNPRYYSLFYNKDEQFVDLTNLTIHNNSYQIDQRQVRYQFYLNSSPAQQKQSAYGWISIEDTDIEIKGKINNVTFNKIATKKTEEVWFQVLVYESIEGDMIVRKFKIAVAIDKIYAQKYRAISVQSVDFKEEEQVQIQQVQGEVFRQKLNSNIIPENGHLQVIVSKDQIKPYKIQQRIQPANVLQKVLIGQNKRYLPIIASHSQNSSQITTLISGMQPSQKTLILQHLHNKRMSPQYVVIQKVGKNPTNKQYKGHLYYSQDPSKKPVNMLTFTLEKGQKKFYIETKNSLVPSTLASTRYVCFKLVEDEEAKGQDHSIVIQELALVGIIGQEAQDSKIFGNCVKVHNFDKIISCKVQAIKGEGIRHKLEVEMINYEYDLKALTGSQVHELVEQLHKNQAAVDLKITIHNLQPHALTLNSLNLPKFSIIRQCQHESNSPKHHILPQTYISKIQQFFETCNIDLLDTLSSVDHQEYHKLIGEGQYNFTKFFVDHIIGKKIDKGSIGKIKNYFKCVGRYLAQGSNDRLEVGEVVRKGVQGDVSGLELVFEVAKNFPFQQQILIKHLIQKLPTELKTPTHTYTYSHIQNPQLTPTNTVYLRYLQQNGKLYRKYTIDMINVYKVTNLILNFQRSKRRSGMRIVVKSYPCTGLSTQWKVQYQQYYPEFVWEQLTICPYTDEFQKIVKDAKKAHGFSNLYVPISSKITSRYLQLQISFNMHPNLGSSKILESVPQSQITPIIQGQYYGESELSLDVFKHTSSSSSLIFVKNINGVNKYSVKNLKNTYFFDSDQFGFEPQKQVQEDKIMKQNEKEKGMVSEEHGQRKNGVEQQDQEYFKLCLIVDELVARGSAEYSQEDLGVLVECLEKIQRGPLLDKILILLKTIASKNLQAAYYLMTTKLPNEHTLTQILKQSKISPQTMTTLLQNPNNTSTPPPIFTNTISYLKNNACPSPTPAQTLTLLNKVLLKSIEYNQIEDVLILHEKYGWINQTYKILDIALKKDDKKIFRKLIGLCKNNRDLAEYLEKMVGDEEVYDEFLFGFENLIDKNRKIQQSQISELLTTLTTHIQTQILTTQDDPTLHQKFTLLTKSISNLAHPCHQILKSYIGLYEKMPQKQSIRSVFLELKHLKSGCCTDLLHLCLNMLQNILDTKANNNIQNYAIVEEILKFVIKCQGGDASVWGDAGDTGDAGDGIWGRLMDVFGKVIVKQLSFGGDSNSKLIDSTKRLKLSVGHCLATILQTTNPKLLPKQPSYRSYIKFLLLNQSETSTQKQNNSPFTKLIQISWLLVIKYITTNTNVDQSIKVFCEEIQKQQAEIMKIKSNVFRTLFQKKLLNVIYKCLSLVSANEEIVHKFMGAMFGTVIKRVIATSTSQLQDACDTDRKKGASLVQKEYVNDLTLVTEIANKPKDWLIHRNGAKNSVLKFQYPKSQQSNFPLLLTSPHPITLSRLLLSLQQSQTATQSLTIPKQILAYAGSNKDELKFLGKFIEIPDNHFINYNVRVFGLDCQQIQSQKLSISLNRYPTTVQCIKIVFIYPEIGYATDIVHVVDTSKVKSLGTGVNFMSVVGYTGDVIGMPQVSNILDFIKQISQFKHKKSLQNLLTSSQNLQTYKKSLQNLSTLLKHEQYNECINKFIMRVCEVSTEIGNETLQKYLNLQNAQQCSKIVSEIILSGDNFNNFIYRFNRLHLFICEHFHVVNQLEPFFNRFCGIVDHVGKNWSGKDVVELVIDTDKLCQIVDKNVNSVSFSKYLCTILRLPPPFTSPTVNLPKLLQHLSTSTLPIHKQTLVSLVITTKEARQWYMQQGQLQKTIERITMRIKQKGTKINEIKDDLQTLSSLCFNANLKRIINKNKYNLDIFNLFLKEEYSGVLVKEENTQLRESFVNFVCRSVLGSENQLVVAQILKDCLASSAVQQNKYFVGQIFLPILNSYSKSTICMYSYSQEQNKIISELSIKNPKTKSTNTNSSQPSKFRLPTNLLSVQVKSSLFDILKSKSQSQSQSKSKSKCNGGNFNLIASHGLDAAGIFDTLQHSFKNSNNSVLFLWKVLITSTQKYEVVGVFFKQSGARKMPIYWNEQCFVFHVNQKDCLSQVDITKQIGNKFLNVYENKYMDDECEYADQKIIQIFYKNNYLCKLYNNSLFGQSFINLDTLLGTKYGSFKLSSAEYWSFQPAGSEVAQQKQSVSLTNQILNMYSQSFFEPAFESRSVLRLLRKDKIYEFPSSITLRQLKLAVQIMKCKVKEDQQSNIKIRSIDKLEISNETTIQALAKKDEDNPIVDLLIETDSIGTMLNFNTENGKITTYLPKKGIMKHFEEINGVTSMIKVIKKSIENWKNKERRQKWYQYVLELQKFSTFPHFFGMYLKDSETFDLLFKLLSGLPDTQQDKKWDQLETKSTQKLLKIVAQILSMDKTTQFREYAMKHQFFNTILQRLRILTNQFKRQWKQIQEKQVEVASPNKQQDDDGTKQIKKKKGVGYGNDGSSNTKWMKTATEAELMKQFEVIQLILNIIENFLDLKHWNVPKKVLSNIYESAFLPYLEDALRAGTLLQISKIPAKFKQVFKILRTLSKNSHLVPILMPIHKNYQPSQTQSLQSLLKSLDNTANIFLSCLKPNKESTAAEKVSEQLSRDIQATYKQVQEAIEDYIESHHDQGNQDEMKNILEMPLDKKYRLLLKDLRFDYIDMKEGSKIKHHYANSFNPNYTPNQNKMIRLAQQLADISTALPYQHTNSIFVRCDKDRVDFMQALIMGANGTPYGHGAYLFDIHFQDNYPSGPPKVNLTTTGHGKIRFNPNLYACGKVCLSLLGTWRGSASENWDPKVSTLLQVLVSIQAIIMSEQIYFNEPGFEGQQGTPEGQKKNQAYSNIVRYGNVKFAMLQNIKNPPKGFQHIIRRHFYLKQHQIMDQCKKWLLYAEKRPANYIGLVNDHNSFWSTEFKKSKTQYKEMLQKAIEELDQQFKKLPVPSINDISNKKVQKKQKKKKQNTDMLKKLQEEAQQQIDVAYDKKDLVGTGMQIDINDEKVKDRWSRYIGAMGIDAVSKQSKADILVVGLGPMALEVVKNLVLSGCRKLTIIDDKDVRYQDLSGGFFYSQSDISKKRLQSILYKIRELNSYVKIDTLTQKDLTQQLLKTYNIVFVTQMPLKQQFKLNEQCRVNNVKFVSADLRGAHCRILNDFGEKFQVLDKNGEEPVEVIVKSISSASNGLVTLLDGVKHPFEDGQVIIIKNVEGMAHKQDKSKSINGTLHKVKIINSKSFQIGDTTIYEPYIRNGLIKNIKTPIFIKYNSMQQVFENAKQKLPIDQNLQFYDFTKMNKNKQIHFCFQALDSFVQSQQRLPLPWSLADAEKIVDIFEKLYGEEVNAEIKGYVLRFGLTCSGYLPPMAAYLGGFISQEIIKAITQKYKPLDSVFYMDTDQIIPQIPEDKKEEFFKTVISNKDHRDKGFETVVGHELLQLIKNTTSFMIGSGAIGCQLLKNFAMIGLGTGTKGKITITDPDHIQNSNLNRQFLFRQKHISKPKSRTAAASVLLMNSQLKGHISALLQRVSESTKNIFSNKFFESLTFVANALDNVAARRYVDQRCVENKIPLFESGTLGPKGHTQVILPFKTESYGSQNDPVEEGQIPHCTLKMFPEQTLHCVEWARDIFGKKFSLQPKAFNKVKDSKFKPQKDDIKSINDCIVMATKGPKTFDDCIEYAITKFYKYFRDDIMQLIYTYPLDAKTKDGEPFWKLPKRPPTPIMKFDPENILHCTFIGSLAVLTAKVYKIPYPKNFRDEKQRLFLGKQASKIKIPDFIPSDEKAKSIQKQTDNEKKENKVQDQQQKQKQSQINSDKNQTELHQEFLKSSKDMEVQAQEFEKDNDQNGHIDFIYAMANLRSINYKLDPMDWITTKLKAGRIVPALATTTSCVAGLQTLQICKYIRNLKLQSMRNSFLNLAVPSLQMSEPGEVKKIKINDKVEVNLWDRWEISCQQNTTFGQVYDELKKRYQLNPIGILQGMSRIDTSKTEQGKKQFLSAKLLDRLDKQDDIIDIIVLFTKSEQDEKLIEHIPPVRLKFEQIKSV